MTTFVVTGANRGLGLALVHQILAQDETNLVIAACRRPDWADDLKACGERVSIVQLDQSSEQSVAEFADEVKKLTEKVEVLVNNAGIWECIGDPQRPSTVTAARMMEHFQINAVGPALVTKALLPLLEKAENPLVAFVSSSMASRKENGLISVSGIDYIASKFGLNAIAASFATELKERGTTVVTIDPGLVDTPIGKQCAETMDGIHVGLVQSCAGILEQLVSRRGKLEETGAFVTFDGKNVLW